MLSLNCLLLEDDPEKIFTLKIPDSENVSFLKKLIKEEAALSLADVDAKDLVLRKVVLPPDNIDVQLSNLNLEKCPKLRSVQNLSSLRDIPNLYILVELPPKCKSQILPLLVLWLIIRRDPHSTIKFVFRVTSQSS
jgi:hypothetical protein